uniref:Uncharacterized protein n=1 Tax=Arundo donax TaxID=35708 RepID=A0A0A8Y7L5_ARUDO
MELAMDHICLGLCGILLRLYVENHAPSNPECELHYILGVRMLVLDKLLLCGCLAPTVPNGRNFCEWSVGDSDS